MIKSSRILSIILMLVVVSASWTDIFAQTGGYYYEANKIHLYLDETTLTAIVTNKGESATGSKYQGKDSYSENIVIPAKITVNDQEYTITSIQDYAFYECSTVKAISIPSTVTEIGKQAFVGCTGLSKIDVNNGNKYFHSDNGVLMNFAQNTIYVYPSAKKEESTTYTVPTYVKTIKSYAFAQNQNLEKIILPDGLQTIETYAFQNCALLSDINIPESLTTLGSGAFLNCKELASDINIPSGIAKIESYVFQGCSKLSTVTLPKYISSIGSSAFKGCTSLKTIDLPKDILSISSYAFSGSGLESVTIPGGIQTIQSSSFEYCNLNSLTISEGITSIEEFAFRGNKSTINKVIFPGSLTSIGARAFIDSSIKNYYVYNTPRVLKISSDSPFAPSTAANMKIHVYTLMKDIFAASANWSSYAENIVADIAIKHISKITLNKTKLTINENTTGKIVANITPTDAVVKDVVFTSSDESIIVFTNKETGDFTTNAEGTATITCTAADGSGVKATCTVKVVKNYILSESVNATGIPANMDVNEEMQVSATVAPENTTLNTVSWFSSDETIATVSEDGLIKALSPGVVTITAMAGDGNSRADFDIAVSYGTYTLTDATNYTNEDELFAKELVYSRTYRNTNWQALYIPFDMTYDDWKNDFEVAIVNNIHQFDDDDNGTIDRTLIEVVKLKNGKTLKAHTPCVIKALKSATTPQNIVVKNATLKKAEQKSIDCASVSMKYVFTGTYSTINGDALVDGGYYAMAGGGIRATNLTDKLSGYRWYLQIIDREAERLDQEIKGQRGGFSNAKIEIVCFEDEEATGIETVNSQSVKSIVAIYDVNGRQKSNLTNGLNIVKYSDGTIKKVMK